YTTVGKVAFLTTVYVILVPFLSWSIYKRYPGLTPFIASIICLAGMGLLSLDSGLSLGTGETLTLACAVFFAIHLLLIERSMRDMDPVVISAVQIGVVAIYSFAGALLFETWPEQISSTSVWSIGFSSLFCTVLAFLIQTNAQKFTPSTHTAILLSLESVFGAIFGVILLGDPLTFRITAGFALILSAVLITELTPFLKKRYIRPQRATSATVLE
ncbi:MAG TPA: DMT family transporter, partial [Synergistales bacterium]|nr:DMT family transporter [Synergistales bacterium]